MRSLLERLDRAFEAINAWLLIVAIGLLILVLLFSAARLAPPTPARQTWSVQ